MFLCSETYPVMYKIWLTEAPGVPDLIQTATITPTTQDIECYVHEPASAQIKPMGKQKA